MADYAKLEGVAASEGVALGPAFVHVPSEPKPERATILKEAVEEELTRFRNAVEAVVRELSETAERLREGGNESEAGIFEAHAEMAEGPEFRSEVEERVRGLESPEAAVLAVGEEYAGMFAAMEDEYLAARADDVRDVAAQIATELMGGKKAGVETLTEPPVILALNLTPSDTARIPQGDGPGFRDLRGVADLARLDHGPLLWHPGGDRGGWGVARCPGSRGRLWTAPRATR